MRAIILMVCSLFLCGIPILSASGTEVYGLIGFTNVHDDESSLGSGFDIGGGIGFRATDRIGISFEIDHVDASRDFSSGVRFEADVTNFGGNVQYFFPGDHLEPYVFAGAGITHFKASSIFPDEFFDSSENAFTFNFGGGLHVSMNDRLSLRPEIRWSWNKISFVNQIRGSVAVGYTW